MGLRTWFKRTFKKVEEVEVRTRDDDGRFIADDPTTKKDEAWTTKDVPVVEKKATPTPPKKDQRANGGPRIP